jgi:hypothetical protein
MTRRSSALPLLRRLTWLMLLVCVLVARGAGPDGWMPGKTGSGAFAILACDGMQSDDPMPMAMAMGMSHGKSHDTPSKSRSSGHPCAFASIGIADALSPQLAIDAPLVPYSVATLVAVTAIVPGRGLAAPPPPSTGPPTHA